MAACEGKGEGIMGDVIAFDSDRDEITVELVEWCKAHDPRALPRYCHVWPVASTGEEKSLIGIAESRSVPCGRLVDAGLAIAQLRRKLRLACLVAGSGYVDTDAGRFYWCSVE